MIFRNCGIKPHGSGENPTSIRSHVAATLQHSLGKSADKEKHLIKKNTFGDHQNLLLRLHTCSSMVYLRGAKAPLDLDRSSIACFPVLDFGFSCCVHIPFFVFSLSVPWLVHPDWTSDIPFCWVKYADSEHWPSPGPCFRELRLHHVDGLSFLRIGSFGTYFPWWNFLWKWMV